MMIQIPGREGLEIRCGIFDFNGTIAVDGEVPGPVAERLEALARHMDLYVLTADTYGSAAQACAGLPVKLETFAQGPAAPAKAAIVERLGAEHCAVFGNGFNDTVMFRRAALSVAVMGPEGLWPGLLPLADVVCADICSAIDLLLNPKRVTADLRH